MAAGPQLPLWLSSHASHSPMRPSSSFWNAADGLPRPRMVSTICVPATAHIFSVSCDEKTASWLRTIAMSTGTRRGAGVGVAVGSGAGVLRARSPTGSGVARWG